MSAEVRINGDVRPLAEADASWIAQSVNRRKHDKVEVTATVSIDHGGIRLELNAPRRPSGGGGRMPTEREREIIDMWNRYGLDEAPLKVSELVRFVKDLRATL